MNNDNEVKTAIAGLNCWVATLLALMLHRQFFVHFSVIPLIVSDTLSELP